MKSAAGAEEADDPMGARKLTDEERDKVVPALLQQEVASREICEGAVDSCRLVRRLPSVFEIRGPKTTVAYLALRSRACGITLGDDVYIRSEFFAVDQSIPLRLLAHEVAHVVQFRRDGLVPFLTRYIWDYSKGLAQGLGDRRAYLEIGYEREARRVAETVSPYPN